MPSLVRLMVTVKATAKLVGNVRSVADNSRTHSIVLDLPVSKGGEDTGAHSFGTGNHEFG